MTSNNRIIPVFDHSATPNPSRMPAWIRQRIGGGVVFDATARVVKDHQLNTVCEEASCPNRGECWSRGTATFMLLGETCTRACGFCNVKTGKPEWFDEDEPRRIADAVLKMALDYVVLTSVNRDDMDDGGAGIFAQTIIALRKLIPDLGIELLTPDFHQVEIQAIQVIIEALEKVPSAKRSKTQMVWGHNIETVPRLYRLARKGSDYSRSLDLLEKIAAIKAVEAKSAIMLGLGESQEEVLQVLGDLRNIGVQRVSMGQYLRPTRYHLPVDRYLLPEEFENYEKIALDMGFDWVKCGPLVRSSYHAEEIQK
ncbi:MAG: lipoyl synthase [Thiohalomonadales bacterium]